MEIFQSDNPEAAAEATRPSTNNDARPVPKPLHQLSLHTAANVPLPQSPGLKSPLLSTAPQLSPNSSSFSQGQPPRSPSVASYNRSSTPVLGRKSSSSSLRGEMPPTPRALASRRSSLNPNMPSPAQISKTQPAIQVEERPPLRACDVAEEFFKKELATHEHPDKGVSAGTIVIVHDQCYGHRFSRPKTSKATLNMIVERPERILASVLGISTAYVRLGERHCDGRNPPHPYHEPAGRVPFKIRKTSRMVDIASPVVTNVHGSKWMEELKSMCADAQQKLATTGKELTREPNAPGLPSKQEFHDGDLYLCSESLNAFQGALGGVLDAVDTVFPGASTGQGPSRAFVCIRPPGHHCSDDHPSGFCWINNVHVGIEYAMLQYGLTHAAIIDFDLHHGDGSQSIAWERNEKFQNAPRYTYAPYKRRTPMRSIGYFSLHDPRSFPCENGEKDKRQAASLCLEDLDNQTIWNIHMRRWTTVEEFWKLYEERYLVLLERTREYLRTHTQRLKGMADHPPPKAAIFLSAGFDASEWEMQGMQRHGVNVPTEFYARFTRDVVRLAEEEGTAVEGRVISVLEGGYSDRALTSGVLSHLSGLTDGQLSDPTDHSGLAFDMRGLALSLEEETSPAANQSTSSPARSYDPSWWSPSQLAELENLVNPPPAAKPKKLKTGPPPTYSSPTQSFTAKLNDPTKYQRSVSGNFTPSTSVRVPTPPPPDVDWTTAAHALSKLLIPFDRQTRSCKPEELSEPRIKKEKPAPALASVHVDPSGRQLRGRKQATSYAEAASDDETKTRAAAKEKANRRRTMAALPSASASEEPVPARSASRRMSIASSTASVSGERSASRASNVGGRRASINPNEAGTGITVKKARGTAAAPSRIPKNPPPVPRVPSNYASKPAGAEEENNVEQLTTGLKRITLKMPTREEHDAREKQKAQEAAKKTAPTTAVKTAARKAPAARPKSAASKKGAARSTKTSKPQSPIDEPATSLPALPVSLSPPQAPKVETAVTPPLEQPQPVLPEAAVSVVRKVEEVETRSPPNPVEPPTELRDMVISPEQLPKPSFMTAIGPASQSISPPRPDTPPAPAPAVIPTFVNYTAHTYGSTPATTQPSEPFQESQTLQWMPPSTDGNSMSPGVKRQDLPIFSSTGTIPFASTTASSVHDEDQDVEIKKEEGGDIWDVPDTPAR